eukprot:UN23923
MYEQSEEKVEQYQKELSRLKNQDITIRSLEEKVKLLQNESTSKLEEELTKREDEYEKTLHEFGTAIKEKDNQLKESTQTMNELKKNYEAKLENAQAQIFEQQQLLDRENNMADSNVDMLEEDLKRSSNTIARIKREKELLQIEFNNFKLENEKESAKEVQKELNDANIIIQKLKTQMNNHIVTQSDLVQSHEVEIESYKKKAISLQQELDRRPSTTDFEELQKKLAVLKGEDCESFADTETFLLLKNRKIQSEITKLKLEKMGLQNSLSQQESQFAQYQHELKSQQSLIEKLENDLSKTQPADHSTIVLDSSLKMASDT